jgi:hypothetical protein
MQALRNYFDDGKKMYITIVPEASIVLTISAISSDQDENAITPPKMSSFNFRVTPRRPPKVNGREMPILKTTCRTLIGCEIISLGVECTNQHIP